MKFGCILPKDQFDELFGRIDEAIGGEDDPVVRWYLDEGMDRLRKTDWTACMSRRMLGYDRPARYEGEECEKWLDAVNDWDHEAFRLAAAQVVDEEIGAENFEFAGQGAWKVCLVTKAGHALKFGRWRNLLRDEITANLQNKGLTCFPALYAHAPDYSSYMCECARQATKKDFEDVFGAGVGPREVCSLAKSRSFGQYTSVLEKRAGKANARSISDLNAFLRNRNLIDIDGENNWGVAIRDGEKVLVVIDYDL